MKLRNYSFLIISFLLVISKSSFSQSIANYTTVRTTGISYSSISATGNAIDSWRYAGGFSQDDNRSNATDIGFDFWYNGIRYTQFSVSTNGYVDFSSSAANGGPTAGPYGYDNTAYTSNGSGTWLTLAPFYDDMTAQGGTAALGNSIKFLVTGTAPNRVLTIEWINMAVYGNTSPSLNFQVKLNETTGVIEYWYGTMTSGTHVFSYTCGINGATLSNTPTAAQLLCQQTANTSTFNNGQQNALVNLPANNSRVTFTPPLTTPAASGAVTFTAVTQNGMTVNWTNWCTNEVGYVLYNSLDNVTFDFVGQTAANATNYVSSGLLPGTLYYWRVYAVTDGALSAFRAGNQTTSAAGNVISIATGNWNATSTWNCSCIPSSSDNVTIANTHTVTVNSNALCNTLTVGQGTSGILRVGNNNTARTITANSNIIVNPGAVFDVSTTSNATHILSLSGNLTNNGTVNFATDANSFCDVTFLKNGNQTISGTATTNAFHFMTLNMGSSINNTLNVASTNFSAPNNFLTLNTGVFRLSTTGIVNITPFTGAATIPNKAGLTVNSANATVNFLGGITLYGNLISILGNLNVGDAANENVASNGGVFQVFGGTVRIAGNYYSADINTLAKFTISGGTLTLPTVGCTSTTIAPFQIDGVGSTFNMSGGTIIIEREGGTGAQNLGYTVTGVTNSAVTGGTLQLGDGATPGAQTMNINSSARVGNLLVNSANATGFLTTNSLLVTNDITIATGTLNANNLNFTLGGNWTNNSTFVPGTGTVIFNGTAGQTIGGTVVTAFRNLTINDAAAVTLNRNTSVAGTLTFTSGVITTGAFKVTVTATGSVAGAATSRFVNGFLEKNVATGANVSRTFEVGNGTTNYTPVTTLFANVSAAGNVTASVNVPDHPSIATSCLDPAKSVNRYWRLTNSGVTFTTYSATCTFQGVGLDADAGSTTANFYMGAYNGAAWTMLTQGTTSATTNQGTGATFLGDLQIGERLNPVITTQPANTTVCNNTTATFSVVATGTGLTYQWQRNVGAGFVNLANGGAISGATTATLTINPATTAMSGNLFRCIISASCGGSTTSASATLTVNPSVAASVSIAASPSSTICAGTNVTFTATPTNGGATPTYQWQLNGVNVGTNSATYSNAGLTNGNTITCTMTSSLTCVTGSPAVSNTITMTVNPNLPVSVSISASSVSICPGTNVTFTATPVNGGTTPSYQWRRNGVNVGVNSPTYSSNTLTNGTTIVCILTSNATPCATGSPATSNTITMIVNPSLPVSVSIAASPSSTICAGTNVTFTATPVNGGATPSYQWRLNGVNVGINSPTYSNSTLTTGNTISCVMTASASCGVGSPATSNTITMTVNPNLPASVSIAASPSATVCAGTNVTFTATPVNGGTTPSYQWRLNGVNVGLNSSTYSNSSLATGNTVSCVMTSNATCVSGSPATSNTITMTVNPNLPASVSIAASPSSTICAGTNVTFTATPVNGGGAPVYQWRVNGGNVGINASTYSSSSLLNSDVVTCILTSNATCVTGSPATSNSVNMTVNANLPVSVSIAPSPAGSVCSGTTVTFTATPVNGGGAPVYQWKLNGSNVGTNSTTYSNSSLLNGDLITCVLTSNAVCPTGNPATSNTITQSITVPGTWIGDVSPDWNDASNWCGGVPTSTTNVIIPSGTAFVPVLSTTADCKNIDLAAGVSLDMNDQTLNVYGAFSGAGMLYGSQGSVLNIGAGVGSAGTFNMDQSNPGISNSLYQFTLNRAGTTCTAGNAINVVNTVGIAAGTFATGNNLTLVSDVSGTARVAELVAGADITGNVTMQRYIPTGADGWIFLGTPVTGATLQQWDDDFVTGGFPGSQYPTGVTNSSIYTYDEAWPGIYDDGYTYPNDITDPIAARTGYWVYVMGTPLTVDVTGPLLKNLQTFPVTYTNDPSQPAIEDGWNLVSNPFPSTIDWDAPGWTKTNINDAVYMYNPTLDQYTSYVAGIGTNGGSNLIASSQAFMVQAYASAPVLRAPESTKVVTDGLFMRTSSGITDDFIRLNVNGGTGLYPDETVIRFKDGASSNFEKEYDALKFLTYNYDAPTFNSVVGTKNLSVNTLPLLTGNVSIPLKVLVGMSGTYTINVDSSSQLPEGCLILEDLLTGVQTDLKSVSSYTFYIMDSTAAPRFVLNVGAPLQTSSVQSTCNGNPNGMAIAIGNGSGPWNYSWQNAAGAVVQTHSGISGPDTLNAAAGIYTVTVSGNAGSCTVLNATIEVLNTDSIEVQTIFTNSGCAGDADGSIQMVSVAGGIAPYTYMWSNGVTTADNINIPSGIYQLSVTDSAGCIQLFDYTLLQNSSVYAVFAMSEDTVDVSANVPVHFNSSGSNGVSYSWNFGDGSAEDHKASPAYMYSLPGVYTVTLIVSDGACSDTSVQTIVVIDNMSTGITDQTIEDLVAVGNNENTVDVIFNLEKEMQVEIEVYNSAGQEVLDRTSAIVHKNRVSLDFAYKAKGLYYLKITTENGTFLKKVARS